MTYTLRVYSRDHEGISSTVITFMTSTGERGSGLTWPSPTSMGHVVLIVGFLLVSSPRKEDSSSHFLTLHDVALLFLCVSLQLPGRQDEPKVHASR